MSIIEQSESVHPLELWDDDISSEASTSLASNRQSTATSRKRQSRSRTTNFVFCILSLAALIFGLVTYFLVDASQRVEFESAFESFARETADIAENNAENTFGQLHSFATAITSVAQDSGDNFPYVSIPHFDLRAQKVAELTGIECLLFVPFVSLQDRDNWTAFQSEDWIIQDYDYRGWNTSNLDPIPESIHNYTLPENYKDERRGFVDDGFMEEILTNLTYNVSGFSAPIAQYGPGLQDTSAVMLDLFTHPIFKKEFISSLEYDVPVISETEDLEFLLKHIQPPNATEEWDYSLLRSFTLDQVKEDFRDTSRTIGYLVGIVQWGTFFKNLLPENVNGIVVKVASDCGRNFTYVVNGGKEDWAKDGDWHSSKYNHMEQRHKFFWKDHPKGTSRHCHFDLLIYPSKEFEGAYRSTAPIVYAIICVAVFVFTGILFFVYDNYQRNKQTKVIKDKARAEAIVTSLFPKHVGQRLMAEQQLTGMDASQNNHLHDFLSGSFEVGQARKSKPLADLFPSATIMFADIVGFTAWSSVREPSQVFTLLETIYQSFDKIAKRRKIFKVETIGDCYVAVAGLPDTRIDHALAMARFSTDCLEKFQALVELLEVELGPDTAELGLRTGLHTGPVTAGVLRGERARFQLFGDTVNTTARIESLGQGGRIHLSQECAEELIRFDKGLWVVPRIDKVSAKGKGILTTFWLQIKDEESVESGATVSSSESANVRSEQVRPSMVSLPSRRLVPGSSKSGKELIEVKNQRLIDWNTERLKHLLGQVVARRNATSNRPQTLEEEAIDKELRKGRMVFDEVAEIINLPKYEQASLHSNESIKLSQEVVQQIRKYVSTIAMLYPNNPFHNFDHASHVAMSVSKLLSRIVAPKMEHVSCTGQSQELHKKIHDHTYGITSDPLTQFACVFSAIIHDCEHRGVPNTQLVKERADIAAKYNNISVAEQNSVDVAWKVLMLPEFQKFRSAIYATEAEMIRFRQLVVNSVMATDIVDKKLKELRNARWEKAFQKGVEQDDEDSDDVNRKATIVIEHLIQASDVSHTMQHWHIFHKWNENLFREMYTAYKAGRSEKDPSEFWYKGEIGFFDFYIIPLAKKLKDCGVFGVSSDEYLNYAQSNRQEWEQKGEEIVRGYIANFEQGAAKTSVLDLDLSIRSQDSVDSYDIPAVGPWKNTIEC